MNKALLALILTAAACCFPDYVIAYPDNVRFGYAACTSCHVSPTGGGILTEYGRMTQAEFMSTWQPANKFESPTYGLLPDQQVVMIGGDTRYLFRTVDSDFRRVFMQADFEVALNLSDQIAVVKSLGFYNIPTDYSRPVPQIESLRQYLLLKPSKYVSFRVGDFVPAYGIMFQDHTINVRQGINTPVRTAELTLYSEYGEINATSEKTVRLTAFTGSASIVGISYRPERYGFFSIIGLPWGLVALDQYDRVGKDIIGYSKVGYQAWKGLTLFLGFADQSWLAEFQFLPIPHAEIYLSAKDNDLRVLLHWNW